MKKKKKEMPKTMNEIFKVRQKRRKLLRKQKKRYNKNNSKTVRKK